MAKSACLFGLYFKTARLEQGFSQWQVVHRTQNYLANIQRIEKGQTHPGVSAAFKLLKAIETRPGDFLIDIAAANPTLFPVSISPIPFPPISYQKPTPSSKNKTLFGPLLFQARSSALVSQTAMAKAVGYSLRNINAVEKGVQEPGILTALSLVLTTGANVRDFFNLLYAWWLEDASVTA